jgi:Tol biopolymer transport system component
VEGTTGAYDADISQDGTKVVMSIRNASGTSDLWLYDIASGNLTQLTAGQDAARARWSPDDTWIAYIKPGNNTFETWAIPINSNRDGPSGNAVKLFSHDDIDAAGGLSWGT